MIGGIYQMLPFYNQNPRFAPGVCRMRLAVIGIKCITVFQFNHFFKAVFSIIHIYGAV